MIILIIIFLIITVMRIVHGSV